MLLIITAAIFLLAGLSVNVPSSQEVVKSVHQTKLLKPMTPGENLNKWLADHPGWRVVQISYMDYQAPWVLVESERR